MWHPHGAQLTGQVYHGKLLGVRVTTFFGQARLWLPHGHTKASGLLPDWGVCNIYGQGKLDGALGRRAAWRPGTAAQL